MLSASATSGVAAVGDEPDLPWRLLEAAGDGGALVLVAMVVVVS